MTTVNTYFKTDKPKHKKTKRETDEPYLSFIRSRMCRICFKNSEPHHEPLKKSSGVSMKGPDRETIPLCREHHTERHAIGKITFSEKYNIDYAFEIEGLQALFDGY